MKHFRPIKTFGTWLLEEVRVDMATLVNDPWNGKEADEWIQQNLGLHRRTHNDLRSDIYIHGGVGFPVAGQPYTHILNFPEAHHAAAFKKEFGGQHTSLSMANNPRRNEAIFDNFTIDDLKYMYGDPLPNVIQYHLVDMQVRLSGYFDDFKYMHQDWARSWLPSAFIYIDEYRDNHANDIHQWFHDTLEPSRGRDWIHGWESSAKGIYEFDDPSLAALFKLRFGEDPIPPYKWNIRNENDWDALYGHLSGLFEDSSGRWWAPDPKAPKHAILLI